MNKPKRGEFYKHYKGDTYQIIGDAFHTEDAEVLILYKSVNGKTVYARPYDIFVGSIDGNPRFKKIQ
jgi:hypothetical protein